MGWRPLSCCVQTRTTACARAEASGAVGNGRGLRDLLGPGISAMSTERRVFTQHYRSLDHALDMFLNFYGPTARVFNAADAAGHDALRNDIAAVFKRYNEATDGTCAMRCEYLQVIATRR